MSNYTFIGTDKSKGWRTGKTYPLVIERNKDPADFFIAAYAKRSLWDLRMFIDGDVTFYDSDKAFSANWSKS